MSDHNPPPEAGEPSISRRTFLGGSLVLAGGAVAIAGDQAAAESGPKAEAACSTVDERGLRVAVLTTAPARVRVEAWPSGAPRDVVRSRWRHTNAADVAKVRLPGTDTPGRAWRWRAIVTAPGGGREVTDRTRRIPRRPAPGEASAFTFAFGSCILQKHAIPALRVALEAEPQFFAMLGDLGYQDDPELHPYAQTYDRYAELFRRILRRRDVARLLAVTPIYAVQDDHDYGQDNAWRDTVKSYAAQAYADVIPGAKWPGANYRRWSIGQVDFFLTDNRRFRDPPNPPYQNGSYRSVLGTEQRTWLMDGLASSTAPLKVVFIPMTMTWYWSKGERTAVLDSIADRVDGTVLFCSGDKHAGAFVRHTERVWELLASPLQNPTKHRTPARPGVVWTENGTGRALWNVVGLVDVDTLTAQTATLRLVREDGEELHREILQL